MISPPLSKNDIALAKNEIHLIKTPGKMQIAVQAFAWLLSYEVVGTSGHGGVSSSNQYPSKPNWTRFNQAGRLEKIGPCIDFP